MNIEVVIGGGIGPLDCYRNCFGAVVARFHVENKGVTVNAFNRGGLVRTACADSRPVPSHRCSRAGVDGAVCRVGRPRYGDV